MDDDAPVELALLGHVGPWTPYDPEDPHRPKPKERLFPFGFAAPMKQEGKRRSPKRRASRKR